MRSPRDVRTIADFALKRRLPTLARSGIRGRVPDVVWASLPAHRRRIAYYVDRIAKGKPAWLAVEQAMRSIWSLTRRRSGPGTAAPPNLLLLVDELFRGPCYFEVPSLFAVLVFELPALRQARWVRWSRAQKLTVEEFKAELVQRSSSGPPE